MPLYEYRCTKCGFRFEKIQHFDAEPETECPKCHGLLRRPLTAPALQFKGAGWYVNDYAAKGGSASAEDKAPESGAAAPAENKAGASEPASKSETPPPQPKPAASPPASKPTSTPSE